jgi:RNA polymerase sigma factor (sigma-70 family)
MAEHSALVTSPTLLARLREPDTDQPAWAEFVRHYGRLVYGWCRHWRLPESDAEEVTQAVLVKLAEKMRAFTYDPSKSFRAYLKTLARYAWCDFLEARKRRGAGSGDSEVLKALHAVEAGDDLVHRLNQQFDQELLAEARDRVRKRVGPASREAFHLTAVEGLPRPPGWGSRSRRCSRRRAGCSRCYRTRWHGWRGG